MGNGKKKAEAEDGKLFCVPHGYTQSHTKFSCCCDLE